MQIEFVKNPLSIIFWTDCCIPQRFGGYNVGPINFIRPKWKNEPALKAHELMHTKQFWKNPIKYCLGRWVKYFTFLPKRWIEWSQEKTFEFECEGYAIQLSYAPQGYEMTWLDTFANWVITKYNVGPKTKEDAKKKILEYYKLHFPNKYKQIFANEEL